jgi:hypothetical protein
MNQPPLEVADLVRAGFRLLGYRLIQVALNSRLTSDRKSSITLYDL